MKRIFAIYTQLQIKWVFWTFILLILASLTFFTFIRDEALRIMVTDISNSCIGLFAAGFLLFTAWSFRKQREYVFAWLFLALGILSWAFGDTIWAILEVFLQRDPFPSLADIFYLLYYPLVIIGFLLIPYEHPSRGERIKNWLDLGIVFLSFGILYWNFLIIPTASYEDLDWLSYLISIAYPIFDLVLFAAIMILLYRKQKMMSVAAQVLVTTSIIIQIIADTIYGIQVLSDTYVSGTFLDYSWQLGFIAFGLAGYFQLQERTKTERPALSLPEHPLLRRLNSALAFSPYLWLAATYHLLIYAQYSPLPMEKRSLAIGIGIIIAFVVARQILSMSETNRLSAELKVELAERQRAQELLSKANHELEERVRMRTMALTETNQKLTAEIAERILAEQKLEASVKEKDILLKEIHHRVKNNLQIISSLLRLQANHIKQPEYNSILLDSQNRVQSMALIHEKLYQSSNLADIDFTSYLESLVSHLHRSYNPAQKEISVKVKASPIQLGIDHAVPCGLIINEFVSNALKHGFPNQSQGEIIVEAELEAENTLRLSVRDNGKGLPAGLDIENSNSLGLRLVQALVGQLNGSLSLDTSQGTCFSVTFTAA